MSKNFYILTLGCQMNKNDSERIVGLLLSIGMSQATKAEEADLIIVNTCSVRQTAEERVTGFFHNWKELKKKNPLLIIAITGCMPGRDKDGKIKKKYPDVDLWFGIDALPQLPKWLEGLGLDCHSEPCLPAGRRSPQGGVEESIGDYLQIIPRRDNRSSVFVSIQTGCDNFCTYCVVPSARGRERNRPLKDILEEVRQAVAQGAKEIILLGQVVNHYKIKDEKSKIKNSPFKDDFAVLLWEINQISGEFRVHFTAADPQYFSDEQIEALKLSKQVNYLHLPVQSGDNEVLKKMNRKYTREQYIELVKKIRVARPGIVLGTDIIVGFCGETEDQFQKTFDLYRECDFDISYHAMYSERSGTPAAKVFKDDVSYAKKKRRWDILQEYMEQRTLEKNQKYLGQTVRVLVNEFEDGVCFGNSDELKLAQFLGKPETVGTFQKIKITQALAWVLRGVYEK
ncbi:MAG: tRNA (N6-isopentenyl adenosine(37)-C2)-methylthiotransferase MiaB [Candidatus Magasanikbacteria bacterium]